MIIAIDGPAGAGKSELSSRLAAELGFHFLDTGALYRAVGYKARECDVDLSDADALTRMLDTTDLSLRFSGGIKPRVILDGVDVTDIIKGDAVGELASAVSAHACVRTWMLDKQRALAELGDFILDGRDIGTTVFPNAELKIYLTASCEERARRRMEQEDRDDYETVLQEVRDRDTRDMNRAVSPLRKADDAMLVDSTGWEIEETMRVLTELAKKTLGKGMNR